MARTSPVHYIEPSAISITPNANNSHRDLAVYVTKDAKIKVLCPRAGIGYSADGAYREWTFSGRNRRLADATGTIPYTIYARLKKTGGRTGYLVFVKKVQHGNDWIDAYSSLTNDTVDGYSVLYTDGGSEVRATSPDYYYVRLGDVSASENGQRTVTLDTGILGTDQFNDEWALNPDLLPLRIELGCIINDKDAGPTPYVYWGQRLVLAATLTEGWTGADIQRFDHWEITRDSGDSEADDSWNHPTGAGSYRTLGDDDRITLNHVRGDDDDFNGAVAATFTVKAIGRPESSDSSSSSSSGSPELVVLRTATINIHAETVEKYELALSTNIVGYNPRTQTFDPASITVRLRATTQRGTVFELTMGQLANAGLTVEFAAVDTDVWTPLVFSGASSDTATASLVTTIAFAAQQSLNVRLVRTTETDSSDSDSSSSGEQATIELMRYTIAFVRDGEDSREREWIFYRSAEAVTFGTGQGQTTPPAAISGGQVNPEGAATGNDTDKNQDGWVPQGWYDEMQGANEDNPYEYGSFRDFIHENDSSSSDSSSSDGGGHWAPFSMPKIWSHFGTDAPDMGENILLRTIFDKGIDFMKEAWAASLGSAVGAGYWDNISIDGTHTVEGRSSAKIDATSQPSGDVTKYRELVQNVKGKLKAGTWYTLSFWACANQAWKTYIYNSESSSVIDREVSMIADGVEVVGYVNGVVEWGSSTGMVKHTLTFKTKSSLSTEDIKIIFRAFGGGYLCLCMPKLERGENSTTYIPHEDDQEGEQGRSITGANVWYALADSGSIVPADSAFTLDSFPTTLNSGKYVWEATKITFSSGSPVFTGKMCLGPTTDFLAGTEVYAISTSNSTAPADNQFGTTYNKTKGYYLWTATRVQYTSGTYAYLNKKCVGYWGDDGTSPYQLKLSDETALINCDENGNVLSPYELSRLMIQQGINSKFTDFNINIVPVGISCNGNSSSFSLSEETKELADSDGYYPLIPSAITVDAAEIRVIATLKTDSNYVLTAGYKINKNKTGATGKTGPSYYPAGEYNASTNNAFSRTDEMCPVVLSDGNYYYLKESSNLRNGSRISPTDQSYGSVYWGLCDNFQVVFIKALFAMFAKLGSFVVSGDWFISQYGTLVGPGTNNVVSIGSSNFETLYKISGSTISTGSGGKAAYAYFDGQDPECESAPTSGNMKFVPSLAIDAKSGTLIASNAKIRGDVKAISGQFGNLVISGNQISVQNGVFTIDSDGTTLQKRAKFAEAIFYKSTPVEITQTRALNLPSEASISAFLTNGTAFDGIHLTLPPAIEAYDGLEVRYLMGYSMGTRTTPGLYPAPLIIPSGTRIICLKSNRIIYGNNNGTVKFCMSEYKNTDYDLTDSYCKEVHLRCAMFVFYGGMTGPLLAEPVWLLLNEDDFKHTHYVLNPTTGQIVSVVDNDWFE